MGAPQGASQECPRRERQSGGNLGASGLSGARWGQEEAGAMDGEVWGRGREARGTSWVGTPRLDGPRGPEGLKGMPQKGRWPWATSH